MILWVAGLAALKQRSAMPEPRDAENLNFQAASA
jgi:hypothetical protein